MDTVLSDGCSNPGASLNDLAVTEGDHLVLVIRSNYSGEMQHLVNQDDLLYLRQSQPLKLNCGLANKSTVIQTGEEIAVCSYVDSVIRDCLCANCVADVAIKGRGANLTLFKRQL